MDARALGSFQGYSTINMGTTRPNASGNLVKRTVLGVRGLRELALINNITLLKLTSTVIQNWGN